MAVNDSFPKTLLHSSRTVNMSHVGWPVFSPLSQPALQGSVVAAAPGGLGVVWLGEALALLPGAALAVAVEGAGSHPGRNMPKF